MKYTAYVGAGVNKNNLFCACTIFASWEDIKNPQYCCGVVDVATLECAHCSAVLTAIEKVAEIGDCTELRIYYSNNVVKNCANESYKRKIGSAPFPIEWVDIDTDPRDNKGCEMADYIANSYVA